jgi:heme-degrading monooxygenase HmoA
MEKSMIARVTRVKIQTGHIDDAIETTDTTIIPDMKDDPGLSSFHVLANRETGEVIVITMWDSPETAEASQEHLSRRFGMLREHLAGLPEPSASFEVVNSFVPSKAPTV